MFKVHLKNDPSKIEMAMKVLNKGFLAKNNHAGAESGEGWAPLFVVAVEYAEGLV